MSIPPSPTTPEGHRDDTRRDELRSRRRSLSASEQADAARGLADQLLTLDVLASTGTLATYLPTDGEIDPTPAVDALRVRGWDIVLPVVGPGRSMSFATWDERTSLVANRFGIAEPAAPHHVLGATELDVVLVPCVALDAAGNRLGFGAGFYDRAFAGSPRAGEPGPDATAPPGRAVLVGVIHEFQLVDRLDSQEWDVPMDLVVTPARVLERRR